MSIVYHSPTGDMWLCFSCGKYYHTMMGDTCNKCELEERRHKELLAAIKKAAQQSFAPDEGYCRCPITKTEAVLAGSLCPQCFRPRR